MRSECVALADFSPIPEGAAQYPIDFSQENRAIKLSESETEVTVGLCDPDNRAILPSLRLFHGKPLRLVALDPAEFASWLGKARGRDGLEGRIEEGADSPLELDKIANGAPVVNYVNGLIIEAVHSRASDIHIECFAEGAVVRFRIDGALSTADSFSRERFAAVSIRLKLMANLNIMEKRVPQDGRIIADLGASRVEMRVSFVPIARGESIALRVLGGSSAPLKLSELGVDARDLADMEELLSHPHGLILVSGPTGSGKTTTLSSMLRTLPADSLKIISIEDPIEYLIPGACQIQTNDSIGLGFDSLLRRVLRQDPSVIMVGEIRDTQTAELAVRAALTGHLVLSSLHTNDSVSCVARLRDLGIEPYLAGSVLRAVIAQRLVRRVCRRCGGRNARSCPDCRGSGYRGRVALFEIFKLGPGIVEAIGRGASGRELRVLAAAQGMRSLSETAARLAREGITNEEEVKREVGS
jgi:general secretion pathway protein E/type IV pilus assembly protein PilB